ncbi:MAG TPA: hypothetical protein VGG33_28795, partial [Polyangia bacterium]
PPYVGGAAPVVANAPRPLPPIPVQAPPPNGPPPSYAAATGGAQPMNPPAMGAPPPPPPPPAVAPFPGNWSTNRPPAPPPPLRPLRPLRPPPPPPLAGPSTFAGSLDSPLPSQLGGPSGGGTQPPRFPGHWAQDPMPQLFAASLPTLLAAGGPVVGQTIVIEPHPDFQVPATAEVITAHPNNTFGVRWDDGEGTITGVVDPAGQVLFLDGPPARTELRPLRRTDFVAEGSDSPTPTPPSTIVESPVEDTTAVLPPPVAAAPAVQGPAPIATLTFAAQVEHQDPAETIRTLRTGHSFIQLRVPDPNDIPLAWRTQYPQHFALLRDDEYFVGLYQRNDPLNASRNPLPVPGQLRLDTRHGPAAPPGREGYRLLPAASMTWQIDLNQVEQVIQYVNRTEFGDFSIAFSNCTHWAAGAVRAAGLTPPPVTYLRGGVVPIALPSVFYQSVQRWQQQGREGAVAYPMIRAQQTLRRRDPLTNEFVTGPNGEELPRLDDEGNPIMTSIEMPIRPPYQRPARPPLTTPGPPAFYDEERPFSDGVAPPPRVRDRIRDRWNRFTQGNRPQNPAPAVDMNFEIDPATPPAPQPPANGNHQPVNNLGIVEGPQECG